jgi:hypothetical protein
MTTPRDTRAPMPLCCRTMPRRRRPLVAKAVLAACLVASPCLADEAPPSVPSEAPAQASTLLPPASGYVRLQGTLLAGGGVRFNNPYRLRTFLGDGAASVSATAPYLDVGAAFAFGSPGRPQHGAAVRTSISLVGVPQVAVSVSYQLLYEPSPRWLVSGRAGLSVLAIPDANLGAEVAAGLGFRASAHLGLLVEAVGNLYYGASTLDVLYPVYPIASLQAGVLIDWERL